MTDLAIETSQSLAFGVIGAVVATSNDMTEGVIDRFRWMPISRLAIVNGQVLGQFCEQVLGLAITVAVGLALGWNPHLTLGHGIELFVLMALWCVLLIAVCVPLALRRFNRTLAA
jgi:ABC-2 type transport system permease protein